MYIPSASNRRVKLTYRVLHPAAFLQPPPPGPPLPAGFAEQYALSGCADGDQCGTFSRVVARCATGDYCPGGRYEYSGNTDRSLCHGAPVYQHGAADGLVLLRAAERGGTHWIVTDGSALASCRGSYYLRSGTNAQPGGGPPNVAAYGTGANYHGGTGWMDYGASPRCTSGCGIAVAAAGGH
jgi:hypothetical protein